MRYEGPTETRRGRRTAALVAVGAVVVIAGFVLLLGQPAGAPPEKSASSSPPPSAASERSSPTETSPSADAIVTAQRWLRAYRTVVYTDPTPTSWAQRVTPLLTEPARSQIARQETEGVAGASWERYTADRCSTRVTDIAGVIPPEAPRSPTTVYVQVTGVVSTSCESATATPYPSEAFSATLELQTEPGQQQRWQVARRLF